MTLFLSLSLFFLKLGTGNGVFFVPKVYIFALLEV